MYVLLVCVQEVVFRVWLGLVLILLDVCGVIKFPYHGGPDDATNIQHDKVARNMKVRASFDL